MGITLNQSPLISSAGREAPCRCAAVYANMDHCTSLLVHAAIQTHDVEDFGGDLFYRIVGTVEPGDLVFTVQGFNF
jgi:hypothetical protein